MVSPTDLPTEAKHGELADRSLGDLLAQLSHDTSELLSAQVELTKTEVREEVREATRLGAIFGVAGLLGFLALLLLSFAAAWGLSELVPEGVAFLIVGVIFAAVAAAGFVIGRNAVKQANLAPTQTMQTIKEDVQWARRQMS
jgi:hypothetical protein